MKIRETKKFNSTHKPTWCPGCGDYGIWHSLKMAVNKMGWEPHDFCIVYDIGCSGNMCSFVNAYGFHGLHGRSIPLAEGVKLARRDEVPVIVIGGDGGLLGEGMGHIVHAMRANINITVLLHDNQVYGLTKGQTAPTSEKGMKTGTNPHGGIDLPVNPLALALSMNSGFVARSFAGDIEFTSEIIMKAVAHRGFSLIDVLQPCVTFNHHNTYDWFRERVYKLDNYSPDNKYIAFEKANEAEKLGIGVFYQDKSRVCYEDNLEHLHGVSSIQVKERNVSNIMKEFI